MSQKRNTEKEIEKLSLDQLREKVSQLVRDNPEKAAVILRLWLQSKTKPKTKKIKKAA